MKRLLLGCIFLLIGLSNFAKEVSIQLYNNKAEWIGDTRSLSPIPIVTHNENTVYIYSDININQLHISIKDIHGNIIYANQVTILQRQSYNLTFNTSGKKEFTIELSYKDINLYGNFIIN